MQYFDFSRLIRKYASQFKAITIIEGYDNEMGDWVEANHKETEIQGAVISLKESKVYRSEGTLTTQDRRLFTLEPIESALYGAKIIYEGKVYSIEDNTENAKFTGVYAYTMRYISAFKEARPAHDITDTIDGFSDKLDGVLTKRPERKSVQLSDNDILEKRLNGVLR